MDNKYAGRLWATKILLGKAEEDIDAIIYALLPAGYEMKIDKCDQEVPGFPFAGHYTFQAVLETKDDSPRLIVYSYSIPGVKAKILAELFEYKPVYPLTK